MRKAPESEEKESVMGRNIVILNGAARKNGNTAELIRAFSDGAVSAGHQVREFYLQGMNLHGCIGCMRCMDLPKNAGHLCAQIDDMDEIYDAVIAADVLVFASPVYWWGISSQLKTAVDRLEAVVGYGGLDFFAQKDTALLMTYNGGGLASIRAWYAIFENLIGCRNLGMVIGTGKTAEARALGAGI